MAQVLDSQEVTGQRRRWSHLRCSDFRLRQDGSEIRVQKPECASRDGVSSWYHCLARTVGATCGTPWRCVDPRGNLNVWSVAMDKFVGRIWVSLAVLAVAVAIAVQGHSLKPVEMESRNEAFLIALTQLGILYIVALFVERSLEVLMKAWRLGRRIELEDKIGSAETDDDKQNAKKQLGEYKVGTQRRALLVGLTLGILVSLSGVRILGPIFDVSDGWSFQVAVFRFTDIIVTAGLIAGGSSTIHELMALIDDFLKASRQRAKQ